MDELRNTRCRMTGPASRRIRRIPGAPVTFDSFRPTEAPCKLRLIHASLQASLAQDLLGRGFFVAGGMVLGVLAKNPYRTDNRCDGHAYGD